MRLRIGRLVGDGRVVDAQIVVVVEHISDGDREIARIAHVAVRREQSQFDADGVGRFDLRGGPHPLVKTLRAAMQAVGTVIDRQMVRLAVERELALGDAIAVAADQGSEIGVGVEVAVEIVEAERNVVDLAVLVGNLDRLDRAAIGDDVHLHAVAVLQAIHLHRLAIRHRSERLHRYGERSGVSDARERDNTGRQRGQADRGREFIHMRPP